MKNNWYYSVLMVLLISAIYSCGGNSESAEVNVYSHRHYPVDQEIFSDFSKMTGIKVNVVSASADELITKLELEGSRSPADLLITVDAGRLEKAKASGLLQKANSSTLKDRIPIRFRDRENYWYAFTYRARAIAYAPDRVNAEEVGTYEDLASPRFKNRVVMRSSEHTYNQSLMASLLAHWGPEKSAEWCEALADNFSRSPRGNDRDQLKAIAAGQGDVTICNTYYVAKLAESPIKEEREVVERIKILFPNQENRGTHINISGVGLTKHAPNKKNAISLMEYLVSTEVQEKFSVENHEYPVVDDAALSPYLEEWGSFKIDSLPLGKLGDYKDDAVRIIDQCGWR